MTKISRYKMYVEGGKAIAYQKIISIMVSNEFLNAIRNYVSNFSLQHLLKLTF